MTPERVCLRYPGPGGQSLRTHGGEVSLGAPLRAAACKHSWGGGGGGRPQDHGKWTGWEKAARAAGREVSWLSRTASSRWSPKPMEG